MVVLGDLTQSSIVSLISNLWEKDVGSRVCEARNDFCDVIK